VHAAKIKNPGWPISFGMFFKLYHKTNLAIFNTLAKCCASNFVVALHCSKQAGGMFIACQRAIPINRGGSENCLREQGRAAVKIACGSRGPSKSFFRILVYAFKSCQKHKFIA
jgi:hypothetical protein